MRPMRSLNSGRFGLGGTSRTGPLTTTTTATSRRRSALLRLGIVVVLSVVLVALDRTDAPVVREVRDGVGAVLSPVEGVVSTITRPVRNAWSGVADYEDVVDENAALREQLTEQDAAQVIDEDRDRRLEELLAMEDLPWVGDIEAVAARVTSGPLSNFSQAVQINKGSDSGIQEGMPVVSGDGLVGRIGQVTDRTATVELVTGPDLQVGVRLAGTGELGTSQGQGHDSPLVIDSALDPGTEVPENAGLVTSGVARSVYPEEIPVARVVETREGPAGLSLELLAEPLVNMDRLAYVKVLLWEPPE